MRGARSTHRGTDSSDTAVSALKVGLEQMQPYKVHYLGLEGSGVAREDVSAHPEHDGRAAGPVLAVHAEARLVAEVACAAHGAGELQLHAYAPGLWRSLCMQRAHAHNTTGPQG